MVFSAAFAGFFLLVDPLGGAPIFQSLTKECSAAAQIVLACKATLIATLLLLVFIFAGSSVFDYFGILPAVFKVAGGTLLFTFSAQLIGSNSDKADKMMHEDDEPQQHQQQPVLTAVAKHDEDTLAIPETSATEGPPVAPSPEDHSCGKLCRWMIALPRAVRSQSVQLEVREHTACIIFPMAMPLMAGPGAIAFAVLITEIGREEADGAEWLATAEVVLALVAVMLISFVGFATGRLFVSRLGETFARVSQSVVGILVAAIGVQYMYDGLLSLFIESLADVRLQAALAALQQPHPANDSSLSS
jgi:small neutral amino acid transporter SnatA (MarC family)